MPAHLLSQYLGQGVLINEDDPDTGAIGRFGLISAVKYTEATDAFELAIDNDRDYVQALLDRFGVFQGAGQ